MGMIDPVVAEFEHETTLTRKVLERIPEESLEWQPHKKSWTTAQLASHIAEMPEWMGAVVQMDEFLMPDDYKPFVAESKEELMARFEKNAADVIGELQGVSDEAAVQLWRMKAGDKVVFEAPRIAVIKNILINHLIHHRGQLTVYLRLNDAPVPAIYGPSADEGGF